MSLWPDLQQNLHDLIRLYEKTTLGEQITAALVDDTLDMEIRRD